MRLRFFKPIAFVAALHALTLTAPAFAQPKPAAPVAPAPKQDLIARGHQLFEDQQYEESIQTLSAALVRPNNTKPQRVEVYRLLALNYITLNRKDEAEAAVRGLLSLEPDYELPKSESPRFRDYFSTVKQKWESEGKPGLVKESEPLPAPVTLQHSSPAQAEPGTQVTLLAKLEDPQLRTIDIKLYYRTGSRGKFSEVSARMLDGGTTRVSIPPSAVRPPFVEYYFLGTDKTGLPTVTRGDLTAPLRIAVPEPTRGWVLPVVIGGSILGVGAILGGLALAGVFKSTPPGGSGGPNNSRVTVSFGE